MKIENRKINVIGRMLRSMVIIQRLVLSSVSPDKEREDPIFIPANTEAGAFIVAFDREVAYYNSPQGSNAPSAECPLNEGAEFILEPIPCAFNSHIRP